MTMMAVSFEHGLALAVGLFLIGAVGIMVRRNILFVLLSVEIMLNAAGLAFVVAGSRWHQVDGQIMFFFIVTMAAAEVAIGLALVLQFYQRYKTLDVDVASKMRDDDA
jgi:NADH-quinone oxidoreductase subunit K